MGKSTPKPALTAPERAAKKKLIEQLRSAGRETATVEPLIDTWARLGSRESALTSKEAKLNGRDQDAVTRSLNTVQTERRKLYKRIWAGVLPKDEGAADPLAMSEAEIAAARLQLEADSAWRARLWEGDKSMSEDELRAL